MTPVPLDGGEEPAQSHNLTKADIIAAFVGLSPEARRDLLGQLTPLAPGPTGPGYEILKELGHGGMGVVYKAVHHELKRTVALKTMRSGVHASKADLERFRTEAEAMARFQHPNIVQIFDVGEQDGVPFFAMEFCHRGSLEQQLGGKPQDPKEAARLGETLARAMHYAHNQGVVHRDLKPANVLLAAGKVAYPQGSTRGETGGTTSQGAADKRPATQPATQVTPKVADFGLAKQLDVAGQTATGAVMGTPSYMAPEQAGDSSEGVGPRTDVYGLGAIMYECLTGRPPFLGATADDTLKQVRSQDRPVAPRKLNPEVPRDLETICLTCLQKESNNRYASAETLADDLKRFLSGEPIQARPVGSLERLACWCRRRPAVAGLFGVSILAVVSLFGLGGWHYADTQAHNRQLQKERDRADTERDQALASKRRADELLGRANIFLTDLVGLAKPPPDIGGGARQAPLQVLAAQSVTSLTTPTLASGMAQLLAVKRLQDAFELGHGVLAEKLLERAASYFESLSYDFRDEDQDARNELANLYYGLGTLYRSRGSPKQEEAWMKAVLVSYTNPVRLSDLPGHNPQPDFSFERPRTGQSYRVCVSEKLVHDYPTVFDYSDNLGRTYYNLGVLAAKQGKPREAVDWQTKAIDTLESLPRPLQPRDPGAWFLWNARKVRAMMLTKLGGRENHEKALRDWNRALELAPEADRKDPLWGRGYTRAYLGDHTEAVAEVEALMNGAPADAALFYDAAGIFSLSSAAASQDARLSLENRKETAERYAAEAIRWLGKSNAAGYFTTAKRRADLRADNDLVALRQREDFQKLLRTIENQR